jgi:hypothetical protein
MADTYDWPTIKAMADERWPNWSRKRSPFKGRNFMTDEVLALLDTSKGYMVEVSTGWFIDARIYGLTTNDPKVESSCFHDWDELVAAVEAVTS